MKVFEQEEDTLIYYLPDELDHFAAETLKKKTDEVFENNKINFLIFDFAKTTFMDSSGIGLVTGRYRRVSDHGGNVYVVNVSDEIDKVLTLSGIYRIVQKMNSKDEIIEEIIKQKKGECYE